MTSGGLGRITGCGIFERAWARIVNHDAVEKTVELLGKPVGSQQ
jgi:hypothetical protein